MPRPVVPMAFRPRAVSRARSSARARAGSADSRARCAAARTPARPARSACRLSLNSASSDSTTPLPMQQRTCSRRMPEGMSDRMVFLPPMTSVWPALWPPWKRATAAARSVSRSTTLPLPSSPHWVPMMMTNLPTHDPPTHQEQNDDADQHASPGPRCATHGRALRAAWQARASGPAGLRKGAMPSITRNARARPRDRPVERHGTRGALQRRAGAFGGPVLQVLEELAVGGDHQQVAVLAERALVGLQAAVEGVELRILRIGPRIGLRRPGIALAADAQRIALGIGQDLGALALGRGADSGARLLRLPRAAGLRSWRSSASCSRRRAAPPRPAGRCAARARPPGRRRARRPSRSPGRASRR